VIFEAFRHLYAIREPGTIVDLPFRWRRQNYADYGEPGREDLSPAD